MKDVLDCFLECPRRSSVRDICTKPHPCKTCFMLCQLSPPKSKRKYQTSVSRNTICFFYHKAKFKISKLWGTPATTKLFMLGNHGYLYKQFDERNVWFPHKTKKLLLLHNISKVEIKSHMDSLSASVRQPLKNVVQGSTCNNFFNIDTFI